MGVKWAWIGRPLLTGALFALHSSCGDLTSHPRLLQAPAPHPLAARHSVNKRPRRCTVKCTRRLMSRTAFSTCVPFPRAAHDPRSVRYSEQVAFNRTWISVPAYSDGRAAPTSRRNRPDRPNGNNAKVVPNRPPCALIPPTRLTGLRPALQTNELPRSRDREPRTQTSSRESRTKCRRLRPSPAALSS